MELNIIHNTDCIEGLKKLESESVDLVFADPPYNLQLNNELYRPNQSKVDAVDDEWDQFTSFTAYDSFTLKWLQQCKRVLKPDGSLWVIGSYHNIFRMGKIIQDLGFWILNDIIWIKTNPMPNFKGTRFTNAHETLIWAAKSEEGKPTFHYKAMKTFNDDKQMRSDWYLPICTGSERLRENGKKVHSTQKPEALLYRIILSTSSSGDLILDPFMGTGTTAVVAKKLGRQFIGFELEKQYIKAANERLNQIQPIDTNLLNYDIERKPPRVPFGALIEREYIEVGEEIYSKDMKEKGIINANSSIEYEGIVGSIHQISAHILGRKANNGWNYWYVKRDDKLVSIDYLRKKYAEEELNYTFINVSNLKKKE